MQDTPYRLACTFCHHGLLHFELLDKKNCIEKLGSQILVDQAEKMIGVDHLVVYENSIVLVSDPRITLLVFRANIDDMVEISIPRLWTNNSKLPNV